MAVSEDDVRHVAALARVAINEQRIPALVRELNGILVHMDALQAVDVTAMNSLPEFAEGMPLRDDVVNPVVLVKSREEFAPAMRDGFFLVPRLDTHSATESSGEEDLA